MHFACRRRRANLQGIRANCKRASIRPRQMHATDRSPRPSALTSGEIVTRIGERFGFDPPDSFPAVSADCSPGPPPPSNSRCLVAAWRLTGITCVTCEVEHGPPSHSRVTMRRRFGSPSASNNGRLRDGGRGRAHTFSLSARYLRTSSVCSAQPSLLLECRRPTLGRNLVEPGFDDAQQHAVAGLGQRELHQRGRLLRVVGAGLDRVRMPAESQPPLRLDRDDLPVSALPACCSWAVATFVDCRRGDHACDRRAGDERAVEADPEPPAELVGVADRPPHPLQRSAQYNFLLDPIMYSYATSWLPSRVSSAARSATYWLRIKDCWL